MGVQTTEEGVHYLTKGCAEIIYIPFLLSTIKDKISSLKILHQSIKQYFIFCSYKIYQ